MHTGVVEQFGVEGIRAIVRTRWSGRRTAGNGTKQSGAHRLDHCNAQTKQKWRAKYSQERSGHPDQKVQKKRHNVPRMFGVRHHPAHSLSSGWTSSHVWRTVLWVLLVARLYGLANRCAIEIAPGHEKCQAEVDLRYVDGRVHATGLANRTLRSKEHVQLKVVDRRVKQWARHTKHLRQADATRIANSPLIEFGSDAGGFEKIADRED
jgi:hypothetical protein